MTRQGWAEKLVGYAGKIDWAAKAAFTHVTDESLGLSPNAANARIAQLLRAEHRRAVRVVKRLRGIFNPRYARPTKATSWPAMIFCCSSRKDAADGVDA